MIIAGDCLEILRGMEPESVHAVVTDPPYELGFMGKSWDASGIAYSVDLWREVLRVLKPGGFLLAFGGTRTYHRMVVAIEDAGFVVNPMLGWVYGSGFPKAADVGKGIDKAAGVEREVVIRPGKYESRQPNGLASCNSTSWSSEIGKKHGEHCPLLAPATPEAAKWDGWKYSISPLKPALEPICMARKPYDGKPLDSIREHEVGAVNVKGCAVPHAGPKDRDESEGKNQHTRYKNPGSNEGSYEGGWGPRLDYDASSGRFPPNLLLSPCGAEEVGRQSGGIHSAGAAREAKRKCDATGMFSLPGDGNRFGDSGTAARFFPIFDHYPEPPFMYCAKASRSEREAGLREAGVGALRDGGRSPMAHNHHPTVKPIALMRWLIRLVTRPGQTVLDPFTGSGTTGCAAALEGRDFIGVELSPEYVAIAEARIKYWGEQPKQRPLFSEDQKIKEDLL